MNKYSLRIYNPAILGLSLVFLALNYDVLLDLFHKWYAQDLTGTYSHGLLVAAIVIYLVFKKILNIRHTLVPTPSLVGLFVLFGSQGVLFLAKLADVNFVQHIAVVTTLLAIIWSAYTFRLAKQFILPALLFSMSFPVWGDASIPLQKVAIFTTNFLLGFTSLPYYHDGALFHFPNGIIEIAPECAGLQQLLVSIIIGLLFSMQHYLRARDIIKTLLYISIAAVLINTIRIIIIMFVGYYTRMESSLITKHLLLGWIIYGIGIYIFLYFYSRRKFKTVSIDDNLASPATGPFLSNHAWGMCMLVSLVIVLPPISLYAMTKHINNQPVRQVQLQITTDDWHKVSDQIPGDWQPVFPAGGSVTKATFMGKGASVYVYVNHYAHIQTGVEPLNMDNTVYNPNSWTLQQHRQVTVEHDDKQDEAVYLDVLRAHTSNQRLAVMYFYVVNGKVMTTLARAKLTSLFAMLRLNYDIKVVCLAVKQDAGESTGEVQLRQFYRALRID